MASFTFNPFTGNFDFIGSGGTIGPGTINQLAYFDTTSTIASLTTATYPSLTELSYVKGVTSAIQTQLNSKQASGTYVTGATNFTLTLDGTTLGLNLGNANTWTAQQTFSTTAPIFETMTAGSVLFAGTAGLLSQDNSNLFWDNTNKRLGIGTSSPDVKLRVNATNGATTAIRTLGRIESIQATLGSNYLARLSGSGTNGTPELAFGTNDTPTLFFAFDISDGVNKFDTKGRDVLFKSTPIANIMTLKQDTGNVGIGTNPGYKLDVNGIARATSFYIPNSSTGATIGLSNVYVNDNFGGFTIQPVEANKSALLRVEPKGTSPDINFAGIQINGTDYTADSSNYNFLNVKMTDTTARIQVGKRGTASSFPLTFGYDYGAGSVDVLTISTSGNVGIATASPSAKLHTISTTEQLRLGYDASNYYSTTVSSTGAVTFNAVGSGAAFNFSDPIYVAGSNTATLGSFNQASSGTAITTPYPAFELVNTDATANNFTTFSFADAVSGASYGLIGGKCTDHANNYGELHFWTRGSGAAATAMIIDSSQRIGIGTTNPATKLHINATAVASTRESLLKGTVSDGGNDAFYLSNGTGTDNRFAPIFAGYQDSNNAQWSLNFTGMTNAANDASDSSSFGLIRFNALRSDNATDPLNGTLASVVNRKLFTWENGSSPLMTMLASGNVGIGTITPSALIHGIKTTEQLRLGYDASNYYSTTVGSTGGVTFDAVGAGAGFTFSDDVKVGTVGKGLYVKEGTDATMGVATLVAGTVTVSTTKVTANSRIFLTRQTTAGTLGTSVDVTARSAGTSFTITSNGSVLDTSTVAWLIMEPA